jgi:hypothetical protein
VEGRYAQDEDQEDTSLPGKHYRYPPFSETQDPDYRGYSSFGDMGLKTRNRYHAVSILPEVGGANAMLSVVGGREYGLRNCFRLRCNDERYGAGDSA